MVRVPGSSEDAGFHRESQDEEDVLVKVEQKTEEALEDRPPVKHEHKNKGSKGRPDLGRGPVNMAKVEIIEDKPKYPPYVLVEDALGHGTYHAPEDHQLTVKTEQLWSQKQQTPAAATSKPQKARMKAPGDTNLMGSDTSGPSTESEHRPTMKHGKPGPPTPKVAKAAQSKPTREKTKAPANSKSRDAAPTGPPAWSDEAIAMAYHRRKLVALLESDPVAKVLAIRLLGQLGGRCHPCPNPGRSQRQSQL